MDQTVFNWIATLLGAGITAIGGILLKRIHEGLDESREADLSIIKLINDLRVEVATVYMPREEVRDLMKEIKDGIQRIELRLEHKADRRRDS